MASIDRRTFLRATTAIAAGAVAPDLTLATDNKNKELMASPSPATPHVKPEQVEMSITLKGWSAIGEVDSTCHREFGSSDDG